MTSVRSLVALLLLGFILFYGFAFTVIGFVGEALLVLALVGLVVRALQYLAMRIKRVASRH